MSVKVDGMQAEVHWLSKIPSPTGVLMPGKRQSYSYFLNKGDTCNYMIPNEKYRTFQILASQTIGSLLRGGTKKF